MTTARPRSRSGTLSLAERAEVKVLRDLISGGEAQRRRLAAERSQAEVGRTVGVTHRTISQWEIGTKPVPLNEHGLKAARAYAAFAREAYRQ